MGINLRAPSAGFLLALTALAVGPTGPLLAQATGSIRGTVTSVTSGRPLADAQVFVVGTPRGTLSSAEGQYLILNVPVGDVVVRVQILGHATSEQTVTVVSGQVAVADFAIAQTAIELDEIVVTGTPGATTKRAVGNAVSVIAAAEVMEVAPVTTVQELLAARTPGLTFMPGAGTVGTAGNIRIRGANSLNAGVQPIFYVDGVRIQGQLDNADFSVLGQDRSPLDHLNPEDIESIEVIKGPAAATLYGAEAATGVIQIITRKGRTGQQALQWTAKAETGTSNWFLEQPLSYKTCTPAMIGDAAGWPGCQGLDPDAPAADRIITVSSLSEKAQVVRFANGDSAVIPQGIRDGRSESYNLTVRGGGDRFSFYASGDHEYERGVFFNNFFKRQTGRTNFQVVPTDRIEATVSLGYSRNNSQLPLNDNASNGLLRNAYRGEPGRAAPWVYGYLNLGPDEINTWLNFTEEERFLLSSTVNYRPTGWLSNRLTVGLDKLSVLATETTPIDTTGRAPFGATRAIGFIQQQLTENHFWTVDYAGSVTLDLNDDVESVFSAGFQYQPRQYHQLYGSGEGLINNRLNLLGSAAITTSDEDVIEQTSLGLYVQEQVSWKDRLFLTGAVRFDDNSAFGENFDWATYPKLSASWVLSEEDYFDVGWVDQLRLRAAWGKAGNAPSPFSADRTLVATTATADDGSSVSAVTTDAYGNPDLKAESGQEFEIGLDAGLIDNRAGIEATFYHSVTRDALIALPAPPSSGFTGTQLRNVGEFRNSGFEVSLWGTPVTTDLVVWDARLAFSTNSNEVVRLDREPIVFGDFRTVQQHKDGYPLGGYWAWDVVRDASGEPILVDGRVELDLADTTYVGPSTPTREISLSNTLTLPGNVRLFAFLDYKGGHYLWSAREWWRSVNQNISRWVNDPDLSEAQRLANGSGAPAPFIDNADFIKLRELSVTWDLPGAWAGRMGARSASLQLAGRNLWLWTRYDLGTDPELNFNGNGSFSRTDYMSVPMMRRLTASVTVGF